MHANFPFVVKIPSLMLSSNLLFFVIMSVRLSFFLRGKGGLSSWETNIGQHLKRNTHSWVDFLKTHALTIEKVPLDSWLTT